MDSPDWHVATQIFGCKDHPRSSANAMPTSEGKERKTDW